MSALPVVFVVTSTGKQYEAVRWVWLTGNLFSFHAAAVQVHLSVDVHTLTAPWTLGARMILRAPAL